MAKGKITPHWQKLFVSSDATPNDMHSRLKIPYGMEVGFLMVVFSHFCWWNHRETIRNVARKTRAVWNGGCCVCFTTEQRILFSHNMKIIDCWKWKYHNIWTFERIELKTYRKRWNFNRKYKEKLSSVPF